MSPRTRSASLQLLAASLTAAVLGCGAPIAKIVDPDYPADCEPGVDCPETCGDSVCDAAEDCASCAGDCGACAPRCGDGACNGAETCVSCSGDCGACSPVCGNGSCEVRETCSSCSADCGACAVAACGDGACGRGETCTSCAADCGACATERCGDGACTASESCASCAGDCGACDQLFGGTACAPLGRGFPTVAPGSRDVVLAAVAAMAREAFTSRWDPAADESDMYAVMTWVLNTLRQNGWVVFRALAPSSEPSVLDYEEDKLVGRDGGGTWTFDLFQSWATSGTPQALAFDPRSPYETMDLLDCTGADRGIPQNTVFPPGDPMEEPAPTELSAADRDNLLAAATYVRNNFPQFFAAEDRAVAYDMMTEVINEARARGTDAMRCLAHADLPPTNPYRWCSDAAVVGQPGRGITVDLFSSWPDPAMPQVLISGTATIGEMTADLIP